MSIGWIRVVERLAILDWYVGRGLSAVVCRPASPCVRCSSCRFGRPNPTVPSLTADKNQNKHTPVRKSLSFRNRPLIGRVVAAGAQHVRRPRPSHSSVFLSFFKKMKNSKTCPTNQCVGCRLIAVFVLLVHGHRRVGTVSNDMRCTVGSVKMVSSSRKWTLCG